MKNIFAIVLLAGAGLAASAQETTTPAKPAATPLAAATKERASQVDDPVAICDLGIQHSPLVDGFLKLGMPENEAALKLGTSFEADRTGSADQKRASAKLDKNPLFENVETGSLSVVGERVTSIKLVYPTKYADVKEFIQKAAPRLGVPRFGFRVDNASNEAKMVCKEFTVDLKTTATGSELLLTDITRTHKN